MFIYLNVWHMSYTTPLIIKLTHNDSTSLKNGITESAWVVTMGITLFFFKSREFEFELNQGVHFKTQSTPKNP